MGKGIINVSGIAESRIAPVAAHIANKKEGQSLIIVSTPVRAGRLATDLSFFVEKPIYVMPPDDNAFLRYEAKNRDELFNRMAVLKAMNNCEDCIVIAPISACLKKLPPKELFGKQRMTLQRGKEYQRDDILQKLASMGYERVPLIFGQGQFSPRGSILDIFTPDAEEPYRIEFFDTEVESIRSFDMDSQRSKGDLKNIEIYPAAQLPEEPELFKKAAEKIEKEYDRHIDSIIRRAEAQSEGQSAGSKLLEEELSRRKAQLIETVLQGTNIQILENYIEYFCEQTERLWDYLCKDASIMVDDPDRIFDTAEFIHKEGLAEFETLLEIGRAIPIDKRQIKDKTDLIELFGLASRGALDKQIYVFTPFQKPIKGIESFAEEHHLNTRQGPIYNCSLDMFLADLKNYIKKNYHITIACSTEDRIKNLKEFLSREDLSGKVDLKIGNLTSGLEFVQEKCIVIWDGDIFTNSKAAKGKRPKRREGQAIRAFTELRKGDYVVHENHGIGKFLGIEQLVVEGTKKDYLKIKYGGEDLLYVPVEQMDLIQKYVGAEGLVPKINRLSGVEWKNTKARAKAAIEDMAKELLELNAARASEPGHAFGPDTPWQREFEDLFPYSETEDQLRCIEEIKTDMEKPEAMDRLLCGDVGFGKTEVAARAIFKCVADGKQAAILVPTTILANQHYHTLKHRFEKFPFTLEMMSRFKTSSQQSDIAGKLSKGTVDIVIGTHRLLSKDIKFKDLGLLVIDEEQRFGVKHKEAIKQLRKNVDVLTLSATPIPRTLHMSLVGIKNMSLIEEPPEERYPVQTYVMEQDDLMIREVIEREIARSGQVYVVFNRVRGIQKIASKIARLVPDARVAVGHGQMNERDLEDVMMSFVDGEKDVLVSTTIIEAGLDIPNVNTIIVLEADHFGLSQLYQLRGRVGRSNRMAYAYLMHQRGKVLSEVAEKRLRAIKEFTEFGAGFKVAMRDLEIRGAGNILGTEQSGHMMTIGYELYCKLVDEAVRSLTGEAVIPDREEASVELKVTAYVPDLYIQDEALKLQMYKRIAEIENAEDQEDVKEELTDRFGDVPPETLSLLKVSRIRSMAEKLCITRISEDRGKIVFHIAKVNPITPKNYAALYARFEKRTSIGGGVKPMITFAADPAKKLDEVITVLELLM